MYFSVSGNSGICRNGGREIHLESHRKRFPWISVGGNSGKKAVSVDFRRWNSRIYQNSGREIHLE